MPAGSPSNADNLVKQWCLAQVRYQAPKDADYVHYWDCPDIEVYSVGSTEAPLSEVTADIVTTLTASWGCPHGPERMAATLRYQGTLGELIDELATPQVASTEVRIDLAMGQVDETVYPLHAANFPAPGPGGKIWQPS